MEFNNFDFSNEGFPILPETLSLNPPDLLSPPNDIAALTSQIEKLSIDINTQSLRVEIERAKQQRLSSSLKRIKRDLVSPSQESTQLRYELDALKRFVGEMQYY